MTRVIIGDGKVSKIIRKKNDLVILRSYCDISLMSDVDSVLSSMTKGTIIINCAAKTNLEWCEDNRHESFMTNTVGPFNLITACKKYGLKLIHISSGCLFDGNDVISTENSVTTPSVWYTRTKDWADSAIQNAGYSDYLILRPRQMISSTPHISNMITKFLSFDIFNGINDENSVTCIEDFSNMLDFLIDKDAQGIFNCVNTGTVSPYYIAKEIKKYLKSDMIVNEISYEKLLKTLPNRRVNTILSNKKLIDLGFRPREASEALDWCLQNYGKDKILL
jgi:dTDP-4-dehydrorhamnose reductase